MIEEQHLFATNTPETFWRCPIGASQDEWLSAIQKAARMLPGGDLVADLGLDALANHILGEGYLGRRRWRLSNPLRFLYLIRSFVPQRVVTLLRKIYQRRSRRIFPLHWPIEDRYVRFQFAVIANVLIQRGVAFAPFISFWPNGRRFAFVLTHDVDTQKGSDFALELANVDERYGFRSSFNFVPQRYHLDKTIITTLQKRGFEVGVHGLHHDGRLYFSQKVFEHRAAKINHFLSNWGAVGFRSPLTHRQPEWMQMLNIIYDSSFFDTDPYETMPGGAMSIWPFFVGKFVELPYTLPQDHTLMLTLGEKTPNVWLKKVEYIYENCGMALSVTHPDYLREPSRLAGYKEFLRVMQERNDYWHALPRDVAYWWRARAFTDSLNQLPYASEGLIHLTGESVQLLPNRACPVNSLS